MKKSKPGAIRFVVCVNSSEPDLETRKVYRVLPDKTAEMEGQLRVIDESGEDYLYPASYFVPVEIPKEAGRVLLAS